MSAPTFLTAEEVVELTQKRTRPSQVTALTRMGIKHLVRPDGSVAILRAYVRKVFGDEASESSKRKSKIASPNWAAL